MHSRRSLEEGNNEHPEAQDHQVLDNISHDFVSDYEIQECLGHKSHANVAEEEIVIAEKEDVGGEVTDANIQPQWYGCLASTDSHSHIFESYFLCIPLASLLGVQKFEQMTQDFQVRQVMISHVEYFLPNLFSKNNTLHLMLAWLLLLEKLPRLEFHHMCKEYTSTFSSLSLPPHFKTRGRIFHNWGRIMQDKSKGRKSIYGILENIPNYRKLYILIILVVIL